MLVYTHANSSLSVSNRCKLLSVALNQATFQSWEVILISVTACGSCCVWFHARCGVGDVLVLIDVEDLALPVSSLNGGKLPLI